VIDPEFTTNDRRFLRSLRIAPDVMEARDAQDEQVQRVRDGEVADRAEPGELPGPADESAQGGEGLEARE
jgi:hypothetical protein